MADSWWGTIQVTNASSVAAESLPPPQAARTTPPVSTAAINRATENLPLTSTSELGSVLFLTHSTLEVGPVRPASLESVSGTFRFLLNSRPSKIRFVSVLSGIAVAAMLISACGSQPAVCQKEDNLSGAVSKLGSAITSVNPSQIQSAGQEVQADANALVTSAQNTYPGQTAEVKSSVQNLTRDINNFANSSDKTTAALALVGSLSQVKNAFEGLKQKYQGTCG